MQLSSALPVAARYLGLTDKAISADFRNGKTLARVAQSRGKSVQGLEQAVLREEKSQIAKEVKEKKMTRS